jgi:hypothetical protein
MWERFSRFGNVELFKNKELPGMNNQATLITK